MSFRCWRSDRTNEIRCLPWKFPSILFPPSPKKRSGACDGACRLVGGASQQSILHLATALVTSIVGKRLLLQARAHTLKKMSYANADMFQKLIGFVADFFMKDNTLPDDEDNEIHFSHTIDEQGWEGVQERAASILGDRFKYLDVMLASQIGKSARIALEARFTQCPGGHGTAIAMQDGCRGYYQSLNFKYAKQKNDPKDDKEFRAARKRRWRLEELGDSDESGDEEPLMRRNERKRAR